MLKLLLQKNVIGLLLVGSGKISFEENVFGDSSVKPLQSYNVTAGTECAFTRLIRKIIF